MSDYIPVFFFPVDQAEIPEPLESWEDAEELIESHMEEDGGVRQTTSRNWWHQGLLVDLAKHWSLEGLEFLQSPVAALRGASLDAADATLGSILANLEKGDVSGLVSEDASVFEEPKWRQALKVAEPAEESSADEDGGFEATIAFFSWVKSLATVIQEAQGSGKCVVVVQPQP